MNKLDKTPGQAVNVNAVVMHDLRLSVHVPWVCMILIPNFVMAYLNAGKSFIVVPAISVLFWAFYPCRDKNFGRGKRLNWARQSVFVGGTFIVLGIGFLCA